MTDASQSRNFEINPAESPEDSVPDDPRIHPAVVYGLFSILGLILIGLCLQIFPSYIDQGLYHSALLILLSVILVEGAMKKGRLFLPPGVVSAAAVIFFAATAASFFMSPVDKYEISGTALSRGLWPAVFWLSYIIAIQEPRATKVFGAAVFAAFVILVWKTCQAGAEQVWRPAVSAVIAGIFFAVEFLIKPKSEAGSIFRRWMPALAAIVLFSAVWISTNVWRLTQNEVNLVRNGWQVEKAAAQVARVCLMENRLAGTGPGSISRKFLEHRPIDATLHGVPDKLENLPQSLAVIAGETGALGILGLALFLTAPFLSPARRPPAVWGAGLWALYGFCLAHECLGGGWLLSLPGGMICFCLAGLLTAYLETRPTDDQSRPFPTSVFVAGLIVTGGMLLLQQLFFWITFEVEANVRQMKAAIQAGRIGDAADLGEYALQLDYRRNDLISLSIGAMYQANLIEKALENSLVLLSRDPLYPSLKNNIGTFYLILKNPAAALPYIQETAEKNPNVENLARLGHLQSLTGHPAEARRTFFRALELFPREMDIFLARMRERDAAAVDQGKTIIEAATYSASFIYRTVDPAEDPQIRVNALDAFRGQSQKFRNTLGLKDPT